ncbi:hypothetical protein HETIRDRAFT_442611 [Heterobasidion irregulare TC 32-1]|uniref:Uncharacterized protein n=1 Tax=Heterobasidion irregulare (strain TC 32-1) TaxID=747525 RepID=W4JPV4_HETIT|nr:uncharacterized protein HETIRDRAFT_442611 [Heterobasidion irregulare TC 32-1]ETW75563.1 hypothetical protein HETIRDRAFT_442611 [Heterobasidion irregulare TC 32-1]
MQGGNAGHRGRRASASDGVSITMLSVSDQPQYKPKPQSAPHRRKMHPPLPRVPARAEAPLQSHAHAQSETYAQSQKQTHSRNASSAVSASGARAPHGETWVGQWNRADIGQVQKELRRMRLR